MKKIYLVSLKEHDYDEYDGWVVIAKNKKEALELCNISDVKPQAYSGRDNQYKDNVEYIKFLGYSKLKSQVVLGSFNAG
jgi:hypothetical protein